MFLFLLFDCVKCHSFSLGNFENDIDFDGSLSELDYCLVKNSVPFWFRAKIFRETTLVVCWVSVNFLFVDFILLFRLLNLLSLFENFGKLD